MLESKQSVNVNLYLDLSISEYVTSLLQKGLNCLIYMLMPEDTSDGAGLADTRLINDEEKNSRSGAKLLFWFAGAIGISLLLGQLS